MEAVDGSIVIGTAIDLTGLKKGVKEAHNELNKLKRERNSLESKITTQELKIANYSKQIEAARIKYATPKFDFNMEQSGIALGSEEYMKALDTMVAKHERGYSSVLNGMKRAETQQAVLSEQLKLKNIEVANSTERATIAQTQFNNALKKTKRLNVGNAINSINKQMAKMLTFTKMMKLMLMRMAIHQIINLAGQGIKNLAQYSNEFNGTMSNLKSNMQYMGNSLATALMPLLTAMAPIIDGITNAIVRMINGIGMLIARLTGASTTFIKAKKAQNDFANATDKSNKATEKQVLGFDQLNKLNDSNQSGAGSENNANDMFETVEIQDNIKQMGDGINAALNPTIEALDRLKVTLGQFGSHLWDGLKWGYDYILAPFMTWVFSEALPIFIDILNEGLKILNKVIEALKPAWQWLWDNFFTPAWGLIGDVIVEVINSVKEVLQDLNVWIDENQDIFQVIIVALGLMLAGFIALKSPIAATLLLITSLAYLLSQLGLSTETVTAIVLALGATFLYLTKNPIGAIIAGIMAIIYVFQNWETISQDLGQVLQNVLNWIQTSWGRLAGWFNEKVFTPIGNLFKGLINILIFTFESFINTFIYGINVAIGCLNRLLSFSIPSWVPGIGGNSWSVNIPRVPNVRLPRLATGDVAMPNNPYLALLGDNKTEKEVVSPLSTIEEAVRRVIGSDESSGDTTVIIQVGEFELGRAVVKGLGKYRNVTGTIPI